MRNKIYVESLASYVLDFVVCCLLRIIDLREFWYTFSYQVILSMQS